jgi:hypothetical protein
VRNGADAFVPRTLRELRYHAKAVMTTAKTAQGAPSAPPMEGRAVAEMLDGVTPATFLAAALSENRRVLARLDRYLIRPSLVPALAWVLLLGIRLLPPRKASPKR